VEPKKLYWWALRFLYIEFSMRMMENGDRFHKVLYSSMEPFDKNAQ